MGFSFSIRLAEWGGVAQFVTRILPSKEVLQHHAGQGRARRGAVGLGVGSVAREREPKRGAWGRDGCLLPVRLAERMADK